MNASKFLVSTVAAAVLTCSLSIGMLAGCTPRSASENTTTKNTSAEPSAPAMNTTSTITSGLATDADIEKRCLCCHLASDLTNWDKNTVNAAMVESMLPTLSDDDTKAFAAYFATIEPQEQTNQH